eukprot:g24251.t1
MFLFTPGGAVGVPCLSPLIDQVQLFHDLLDDPLKQKQYKKMSLREFDLAAYQAYARMDTDMIVEAQKYEKTNPLEMSFEERQDLIG